MIPRYERRHVWLRRACAAVAVLLATGCGDSPHPTAPSREAAGRAPLTAADSTAYFARLKAQGLDRPRLDDIPGIGVGDIVVEPGQALHVTVASMENGRCEDVTVSGAINAGLFSGIGTPTACAKPSGTAQTTAATVGGAVFFHITSVNSKYLVTKTSLHTYTVSFEDGAGDNDFNDIVLNVEVVWACNLFKDPASVTDALLNDPAVQDGLKDLWAASLPLDSIQYRREAGGYIVRDTITQQISIVPYTSNQTPNSCKATVDGAEMGAIEQSGKTILGLIHTHPYSRNTPLPPNGACLGITNPGAAFGDGASDADKDAQNASPYPSYIIDPQHVHVLNPFQTKGRVRRFDRDQTCAKG